MEPEPASTTQPRRDRDELSASMAAVQDALATVGSDPVWAERMRGALGALAADLRSQTGAAHIGDGTHRRVLQAQPRLSKAVADQDREQDRLAAAFDELRTRVGGTQAAGGVADLCHRGRMLMDRLARHRQRGSDLLHEADQADLGGEA